MAFHPEHDGRRRRPGGGPVTKVGVIGAGMTLFRRRLQETGKEMCFEATKMALDSAGLTRADVDMVVNGTAPDAFDGVHMKGEYLADGCGGYRKPYTRVFTGGGTGVFSTIAGWWHVASGLADVAVVGNEEKMSSCQPHPQSVFANIWDPILDRPLKPNLVWIFAMEMNRYMSVYGVKKEDIARVAVKNKRNAVAHPCAQLADPNITVDDVLNSEVMAWPVQRLDISPPSDGASAVVLASEDFIRKRRIKDRAWVSGVGWCIDSTMWTDRDLVFPEYVARAAKHAYKMAKIDDPRRQIDFAEPYDPFDYKELHHLEGLLLADKGEAPVLTREGVTERDGKLPVCPSGGLLGVGNPIAATMGMKIGELFWQLTGQAGKRQIPHEVHTGRFIARTCHKCERILFPPRMFCEECFRPTDEWTFIQDTGTIETFSVSYLDTDAKRIVEPILVGVVSLDGASSKMGMMHYFGEMTKDEIRIGMRVKAEWKPPADRRGSVLDVRYFRPLREGERW